MASRDVQAREGDVSKALRLERQDSHPNPELWGGEEGVRRVRCASHRLPALNADAGTWSYKVSKPLWHVAEGLRGPTVGHPA